MIPLNYNQLYYFSKIAEFGSIARASKAILISSPALSMQLKELEESLGAKLFDRTGKKLVLTETGSIVYEYAKDIFKLGVELRDTIGDRSKVGERLKIEIGCQDSVPKNVPDELLAFLIDQKSCKVILKEGNQEELIKLQSEFKLDLILTNSMPNVDNSFIYESRLLLKESLVVVGHPKFKSLAGKMKALQHAPFILPTFDSSLRQKLDLHFHQHELIVDVVAEVEDKATEIDLALKGLGLIAVMKSSVPKLFRKDLIEICSFKDLYEEIWMFIGKRKILNPVALYAMKNFNISH